jgi:hypothetical protein
MIPKTLHRAAVAAVLSIVAGLPTPALAAVHPAPANTPTSQGSICNDGTTSAKAGRGACRGHGGIAKHVGTRRSAPMTSEKARRKASESGQANMRRESRTRMASAAAPSAASATAGAAPTPRDRLASGRGGEVWVNSASKVYHCRGDRWYGQTKQGQYMSEADAKAQGYRPDHGKGCS